MRRVLSLVLLPLLSQPVWAADTPSAETAHAHHARKTWEQRFAAANQAHDGHLTPQEAKTGYASLGKHFDEIDSEHKGYVTEDDVRAWHSKRKTAHHRRHASRDDATPRDSSQVAPEAHKTLAADASRAPTPGVPPARGDAASTE